MTDLSQFVDGTVYFKCPKRSWIAGRLEAWDPKQGGTCKATRDGNDTVARLTSDDIHPVREEAMDEDTNDLLLLTELHDATLLNCVKRRYFNDIIYTNIGAIVVALNPFNFKIPRYMDAMMPQYLAEGEVIEKSLPHSWACAHNTYFEMLHERDNQSILVSGESGAGKTEASKIVMKYLAQVSCLRGEVADRENALAVGTKINLSSPSLEAFGNAKTVRNDNSSRFGKFMKVKFDDKGFLRGAFVIKYLLEKSRIVTAAQGERIYHSFYLVLRSKECCQKFQLEDAKKYRTVGAGGTLNNVEYDTEKEYEEVCDSMRKIGISNDNIQSMWRVLGGILHLENIDFVPDGEGVLLASSAEQSIERGTKVWGIPRAEYEQNLKETVLMIMNKPVKKTLNVAQAMDGRSALNKALYDNTFSWLVEQINAMLDTDSDEGSWIGLLDIFGFEDFKVNSFEQLCINLTNETLQHHYNTFIFCKDVEECRKEGVDMTDVPFPDNTPCLQLMTGKGGILPLLDEECQLGSGTDSAFLAKITQAFAGHQFFEVKRLAKVPSFIVKHYAGDVSYEVENFREKNLDTLKDAWKVLLRTSTDDLIKELLPAPVEVKGAKPTVGGTFRRSLQALMDVINSTNPHWIRCIKPHPAKKPLMFDGISVYAQLSSSGVLGTVRIRKAGYAVRIPHEQFVAQFKIIAVSMGRKTDPQSILDACGFTKKEAQVGTKRVFLRSHIYLQIEIKRKSALADSAKVVQTFAHAARQAVEMKVMMNRVHKTLIDNLRGVVKRLVEHQVAEEKAREDQIEGEAKAWKAFNKALRAGEKEARQAEEQRLESIRQALREMHYLQQQDIADTERTFRETIISEWENGLQTVMAKWSVSYQTACELTARREHKESETILNRERRQIRESRRTAELDRILDKCAKRLDPTLKREDRTMRALQRQAAAKEERLQMAQKRQEEEEARRQLVAERKRAKIRQQEEQREQQQLKRWKTAQEMAKSKVAFERWERVMREDFEWQKMEYQILKGQQLALEEQRRVFLLKKGEQDKARREEMRAEDTRLRDAKNKELAEEEERRQAESAKKAKERAKEERKIFNNLNEFRHELKMREKAKRVERSIAWDNDRMERMLLQRPDIPIDEIDETRLAQRVGPPPPFVMAGNVPTYAKVWTPFKVVKLEAAPSSGVAQGGRFTVSWLATRATPSSYILVSGSSGEVGRHMISTPVGECQFVAPDEWFSELDIEFYNGGEVQHRISIAKATS